MKIPLSILILIMQCVAVNATVLNKFDLVVYGATVGGVVTAVAAAREGLKVAMYEKLREQ